MMTRHTGFRTILTMSVVLLAGCSSGGNNGNGNQPDNTSPVITLTGDNPQVIAFGEAYAELGATANDNRDGDLTASIVIDASAVDSAVPGTYQVTYDITDAAGNAATTVTRTVIYEDQTPPVITLIGDDPLVLTIGSAYTDPGANASDNVDGDISASITIDTSGVDTSTPGDYLVTYNVTDATGNAATEVTRRVTVQPPVPKEVEVTVDGDTKQLIFSWDDAEYVDYYRLFENPDGHSGFTQVGDDIPAETLTSRRDIAVHLFDWVDAQYIVEACNETGCSSSDVVTATDVVLDTIGYFKASNTGPRDLFGYEVALSADGTTLAVSALWERSSTTGINGDQIDNSANEAGAVYVFRLEGTSWAQEAYVKASNTEANDDFGFAIALSADGNTLAVSAVEEDSSAIGINGDQADNLEERAGAVYLFRFEGTSWAQQAYIKASNPGAFDGFGASVALSADGDTLAVSATGEDSSAAGVNGDQADNSAPQTGAAYLFRFDGNSWAQQAYIKASNPGEGDSFGWRVALSADGNLLAVGATGEGSNATGVNGVQTNNSYTFAGAVYVFRFDGASWAQQAYVKASNTGGLDRFGGDIALSADGTTLAVGAIWEESAATGINGDQADNSASEAGAVYLFRFNGVFWAQRAYMKASNTEANELFGVNVALSADGDTLAVGATAEGSRAIGINGDQSSNSAYAAGAVYLFRFDGILWAQHAYIKAANTEIRDRFSSAIAISADGNTLAVGAQSEDSGATGVNGVQVDNSADASGAVYVY